MSDIEHLIKEELENNSLELIKQESEYAKLLNKLTKQISYMISNDFNSLLNALYRIDVDEQKLKFAISEANTNDVAETIAKMVIDRIIKKMEYRKKYSS